MKPTHIQAIYTVQTLLKVAFLGMSVLNMNYTILVGFLASLCGMIRILKVPQFNKQYLEKVLLNPHGQNILYIGMGCMGSTNFLFFAPLFLYFFYGLAEFYNQRMPGAISPKIQSLVNTMREHRWYFMQAKSRIQIIYFIYLLITIPFDYSKILKCLLMAQFNMLKYRASRETQYAASVIHNYVRSKISGIGFLCSLYDKIVNYVYGIATQQPEQQQQQQ